MEKISLEAGRNAGLMNFGALDARGSKWKNRNVPVHIRKYLWVPFYITHIRGLNLIYIINPPEEPDLKVHFKEYELL